MPPHPYPIIPPKPHQNISPHTYPGMPQYPNFLCQYFTFTPMYAPYVVTHDPHITSLVYLHRPQIILPTSMFAKPTSY